MIRSISQNYSKSIYFDDYSNELFSLIENTHKSLLDLNINLISFLCEKLHNGKYSRLSKSPNELR